MELKGGKVTLVDGLSERLNCTFMELKDKQQQDTPTASACLNCTFMELKEAIYEANKDFNGALIVPLWN